MGDNDREFFLSINRKSDYPLSVLITKKDDPDKPIKCTLINLYKDGDSQSDGTFYFKENVRNDKSTFKQTFLFGDEIESIIIE